MVLSKMNGPDLMKRFFWFWKYHVDSFYWLISKLIPWTLSFWINEIHAQECLGASMIIKLTTMFGLLLFINGYLCFGCKQGTLSSGHRTILGIWGRQIPLAICTTSTATLQLSTWHSVIVVGIAELGSSFWTSGFSYFSLPRCVLAMCLPSFAISRSSVFARLAFHSSCVTKRYVLQRLGCFAKVRMCLFPLCQVAAEAAALSSHVDKTWWVRFPGLTQLLSAQLWEQSG